MKYLVTGGAGFIGSHIAAALLSAGHDVSVLDNLSSGHEENLLAVGSSSNRGRLELLRGDIRDRDILAIAATGIDVVFHEAAFVSVPASIEHPQDCFDVNCVGTTMLLDAARQAGVRRVVLASSAAVYGDSQELPLHESVAPRPLSPYAASKLVDEIYARLYTESLGLPVCALRYFNVFGPRQRPDTQYAAAVPIFIRKLLRRESPTIYGDGGQTRDLVFVADVVKANLLAAQHVAAPGQVFNVCTGARTSIHDLVEALYGLIPGAPPPLYADKRSGDIYESVGDPAKARSLIGFAAETSLGEGLKQTVAWLS